MKTPFKNDPFALVWKAFKNLYPDKECQCFWETQIRTGEDGAAPYGLTDFGEDGTVFVFVTADLKVMDAVEILAHELAHVAVGVDREHDGEWEAAFHAIFSEYNRIGDQLFAQEDDLK